MSCDSDGIISLSVSDSCDKDSVTHAHHISQWHASIHTFYLF